MDTTSWICSIAIAACFCYFKSLAWRLCCCIWKQICERLYWVSTHYFYLNIILISYGTKNQGIPFFPALPSLPQTEYTDAEKVLTEQIDPTVEEEAVNNFVCNTLIFVGTTKTKRRCRSRSRCRRG